MPETSERRWVCEACGHVSRYAVLRWTAEMTACVDVDMKRTAVEQTDESDREVVCEECDEEVKAIEVSP